MIGVVTANRDDFAWQHWCQQAYIFKWPFATGELWFSEGGTLDLTGGEVSYIIAFAFN